MVEIQNVYKKYRNSDRFAVENLSLHIKPGEIFGLLGTNGAGKTTLFSMLSGLFPPTAGDISINGLSIKKDLAKIKKIIGVVPQDIALYPTLSARENLFFFGKMYGLRGQQLKNLIEENLNIFGLSQSGNKKIKTFSGGMKRRINLIAGILHNPKLLLLDEPTVGIDAHLRMEIMQELKKINQNGTGIIYTSHYLEEAEKFCTDIAIIDEGKIISKGKPKDLIQENGSKNLEELFFKLTENKDIKECTN